MSNSFLIGLRLATAPFPGCCPSDVHQQDESKTQKSDQEQQCTYLLVQKKLIIYHCSKPKGFAEEETVREKTGIDKNRKSQNDNKGGTEYEESV